MGLTYDDATFRKPLRSFPPKNDIRYYRYQLDEIYKVNDGFGNEIANKYSYLNYISTRVGDYLLRSGIKRDDIGASAQYAIQTLIDELLYLEKSRGFNSFHDFESELLPDESFHLGSQQLLKFDKRLLKVQSEINGFEVNYKPNLLIIYLTLRIELLAIAYRFILAFKDIWKSEYAKSSKKEKKGELFFKYIQKIDSEIDKAWWKTLMNKYASDVTSLLDDKQTQNYLINSSLSGLILFISMAQSDTKSYEMKQELLDVVDFEKELSKYFKTTKVVSKDVYLEELAKMKSIVRSMKGKFKADTKIFEFVDGCVFYQVSDAELTDGKETQNIAVSKIVFPTTANVEPSLMDTNILTNDQHYRQVSKLWREWYKINKIQVLTGEELYKKNQEVYSGFNYFCWLLIVKAFNHLNISPKNKDLPIEKELKINGRKVDLELIRNDDQTFEIHIRDFEEKIRFVPIFSNLNNLTTSDDDFDKFISIIGQQVEKSSCKTIILFPDQNIAKHDNDRLIKINSLFLISAKKNKSYGILPVSPFSLFSVEKVGRAIRQFVDGSIIESYPPEYDIDNSLIPEFIQNNNHWIEKNSKGDGIYIFKPPSVNDIQKLDKYINGEIHKAQGKGKSFVHRKQILEKFRLRLEEIKNSYKPLLTCPLCNINQQENNFKSRYLPGFK